MKKIALLTICIALMCAPAHAQGVLGRLGERARQAVENNVGNKIEQGINDLLNGKENNKEEQQTQSAQQQPAAPASSTQPASQVQAVQINWNNYDFVSGDEIIFEDTMEGEQLGEFPSMWDLFFGEAQITEIDGSKTLCISQAGGVTPLFNDGKTYLTEECTVEYDVFIRAEEPWDAQFGGQNHGWASWMHLQTLLPSVDKISEDRAGFSLEFRVVADKGEAFNPTIDYRWTTPSGEVRNGSYELKDVATEAWHHVAISFNKRAIKAYFDEQ